MKRSAALAPLSRDHHHALVIARDLAQAAPDEAEAVASRFVQFLAEHELRHFALEESVLLPALADQEAGVALARRVREDHEWLRAAMRRLQHSPRSGGVEALHQLGARLRAHVQMEEHELFPCLERSLDPVALQRLGARLGSF